MLKEIYPPNCFYIPYEKSSENEPVDEDDEDYKPGQKGGRRKHRRPNFTSDENMTIVKEAVKRRGTLTSKVNLI